MTRQEALTAADAYVTELLSERNERGFPKAALLPQERISEVLRVASFLLGGSEYD